MHRLSPPIENRVWRRVAVPAAATLGDLQDVIQAAMGWENDHMHAFWAARGGRMNLAEDMQVREALSTRGSRIEYMYDFGDSWEHEIKPDGFFQNDLGTPFLHASMAAVPARPRTAAACGGTSTSSARS